MNRIETLWRRCSQAELSTRRGLRKEDVVDFVDLVKSHPRKRVRVYSGAGFVPNSYKWRCQIEYIERGTDGKIHISFSGAQRRMGTAPLATVNGRAT